VLIGAATARAQVTRAPAPVPTQTARPSASAAPAFVIRPFGMATGEFFTARKTFEAIFRSPVQPFVGGGVQLVVHRRFVIEATASWWQKQGERAFLSDGEVFQLGIPLAANLIPAEVGVGYRFHTTRRVIPYATVGAGWYTYREDPNTTDAVTLQHAGYLANVGIEYRLARSLALTFDAQGTYVPGILGTGGISELAGEKDLGGIAGRVRLVFGR
jgi:hypothetical protein